MTSSEKKSSTGTGEENYTDYHPSPNQEKFIKPTDKPSKIGISPCLWFDSEAEEAANWYVSIFPNSSIDKISYYTEAGKETHGRLAGSVMTVQFTIMGQTFTALNGGPLFKFNEAVSFQVHCDKQSDIDYYWNKLCQGGKEGPCGWCKDKYGVSWQIEASILSEMLMDKDKEKVQRVTDAFMKMKKFNIEALHRAFQGTTV